jgi:predicted dehydrogenase
VTFTAAVIGLGNIGQGFDYDCPDASRILTHATAFHYHPGFELVGGVDPDAAARQRFTAKFGKPAFTSVPELWTAVSPDVVAISVPTPLHSRVFHEILAHKPKGIICEKPLAVKQAEGEAMVTAAEAAGSLLLVNYMRRFEPGVIELKRRISCGELGTFYKGVQWYSKGILTNGSHFVDLLSFLFGPASRIQVLQRGRAYADFDYEPDALVRFGNVVMYFLAAREECFSMRDLQLISDKGEVRYATSGEVIEWRCKRPHPLVPGYTILAEAPERIETDLRRYQWHVAQALLDALTTGTPACSTGLTALRTMATVQQLMTHPAIEAPECLIS